ncbi:LOW QUALITY PROTEIN: DIE2_ALG10 domain-containing protein, partial [Cephalotus follicularis]
MLFVACTGVLDITLAHQRESVKVDDIDTLSRTTSLLPPSIAVGSNLRKRKSDRAVDNDKHLKLTTETSSTTSQSGLLDEIRQAVLTAWGMKWKLLVSFSPFVIVLLAFIAFVLLNGSVVLGAKEAHAVSPHFAQILYCGLVSTLAMAPVHLTLGPAVDLFRSFWKNKYLGFLQLFVALSAGFLSVHFFSIAHPYLLADNRHYTFYIWRMVIKAHWLMKYLLVPLYVYSWFSIFSILGKVRKTWVLIYFLATAAVLIPTPLIEFRYYTIPFFFLMLHSDISDGRIWLLLGILFIAINVFTIKMFLFRPFYWNHEPGIQRFIW